MSTTIERSTTPAETGVAPGDLRLGGVLLVLAVVLVGYQVVTAPFIPVLTIFAALYAAVGVALLRSRRRSLLVVAGLLALAYLGGGAPVFAEHLAHPESPLGFLTDVAILLGLGAVLVGVVRALRGAAPTLHRPVLLGAATLGGLAVVVSALAAIGTDSEVRQAGDVEVVISDWAYPDLAVPATAGALWIDNRDPFHHTLLVEGADVRAVLPASTAVRVPVELEPGDYRYFCDVPGHEDMSGMLRVR